MERSPARKLTLSKQILPMSQTLRVQSCNDEFDRCMIASGNARAPRRPPAPDARCPRGPATRRLPRAPSRERAAFSVVGRVPPAVWTASCRVPAARSPLRASDVTESVPEPSSVWTTEASPAQVSVCVRNGRAGLQRGWTPRAPARRGRGASRHAPGSTRRFPPVRAGVPGVSLVSISVSPSGSRRAARFDTPVCHLCIFLCAMAIHVFCSF